MNRTTESIGLLAIDDEAAVLFAIKTILESEGYRVYSAASPAAASSCMPNTGAKSTWCSWIFSMPEMDGESVYQLLCRVNPAVRILIVTASSELVRQASFGDSLCGCVAKPFRVEELIRAVRKATAAEPHSAPQPWQARFPKINQRRRRKAQNTR